jgi:hypothetical protein
MFIPCSLPMVALLRFWPVVIYDDPETGERVILEGSDEVIQRKPHADGVGLLAENWLGWQ